MRIKIKAAGRRIEASKSNGEIIAVANLKANGWTIHEGMNPTPTATDITEAAALQELRRIGEEA